MYVAVNDRNTIVAISDHPFSDNNYKIVKIPTPQCQWKELIGTKLTSNTSNKKIAIVCNWNAKCGISTYSKHLVEALRPLAEVRIFSEVNRQYDGEASYCWRRGESMKTACNQIISWEPDLVIIQHEFGIFPKAAYFLQMLQALDNIPYLVTMHSVYEHLDKTVCSAAAKHIVVHSQEAKDILRKIGNNSRVTVIPHGCIQETGTELWNIFQNPYTLVQFGFGFRYKGVDIALDAVHHLKKNPKYKDIFYCYLCSENSHTQAVHNEYHDYLLNKIDQLKLYDNAVIIKKFQTEQTINHYLRTAKIALFPYVGNPENMVYGASGAIRVAMANNIPTIASACHQFDDLNGVVPRPNGFLELATVIDKTFSDGGYRQTLLAKAKTYIEQNTWPITAQRYLTAN